MIRYASSIQKNTTNKPFCRLLVAHSHHLPTLTPRKGLARFGIVGLVAILAVPPCSAQESSFPDQSASTVAPNRNSGNLSVNADSLENLQDDWSNPQLIPVENALLKTIESTKLSAEVTGRISSLKVTEGDLVAQDQLLGAIDDKAIRLQQQRAKLAAAIARHKSSSQIDLNLAEKRSLVAKNELDRAEAANVRVPNTYPTKEIDRLRLVYDTSVLEIERANHEQEHLALETSMSENDLKVADELVARHQIVSPVNGMVVSVSKHRGEWVEPGAELLQIFKLDRLRIEGFVSVDHAASSLVNRSALIGLQLADRSVTLQGKVVFVYPEVNPVNSQMRVFLEVDNPDGILNPGMRVRAAILPSNP